MVTAICVGPHHPRPSVKTSDAAVWAAQTDRRGRVPVPAPAGRRRRWHRPGPPILADYYSEKGETPGRWMGSGLRPVDRSAATADRPAVDRLWSVPEGSEVREEQMKALFGEGLTLTPPRSPTPHRCAGPGRRHAAAKAGPPLPHRRQRERVHPPPARAYAEYNATLGPSPTPRSTRDVRADIRTAVARTCSPKPTAADRPTTANCRLHRPPNSRPDHRRRRLRPHFHPGQIGLGAVGARPAADRRKPSRTATTKPSPTP